MARSSVALALVSIALFSSSSFKAEAQPFIPDDLALCMAAHSGHAEAELMKKLFIAALQDDVDGMRTGVADLGAAMVKLATRKCDVKLADLQAAEFEAAGSKYGEILGERIIQEAFSKL